jgi:anti-sigma B factor antagonist
MRISEHSTEDVTILDLLTPITGDSSGQLFMPQIEALLEEGKRKFVLNLAEMNWINSSGLGLFIGARRRIEEAGGRLVLCGVNQRIQGILDVTALSTMYTIVPDVHAALEELK